MICNLCPRKCGAIRTEQQGSGACGAGTLPRVARIAPHMWEEPCISGKRGSGAVFFSGCTMRCVFCQNYKISAENLGTVISVQRLADEIKRLEQGGAHNINLVSPTPYVPAIIKALEISRPGIPVVYNTSGYENISTLRALDGIVSVYLPDFKYADNKLGEELSGAKGYADTALAAIGEMLRQTGAPEFDGDGMIQRGTIIRHLVLPNHTKNSINVLDIIKENLPKALVSLMGQYVPMGKANEFEKLNRKITRREYEKVKQHLFDLDLDGFVQELESADEKYVPVWDYKL